MLLYVVVVPQGGGSSEAAAAAAAAVEAQGKIFWWLCADFYSKTPGDRCSLVSLYVDGAAAGGMVKAASRGGVSWGGLGGVGEGCGGGGVMKVLHTVGVIPDGA